MSAAHWTIMPEAMEVHELLKQALALERISAYDAMQIFRLKAEKILDPFAIKINYWKDNQYPIFLVDGQKYESVAIAFEALFCSRISTAYHPDGIIYLEKNNKPHSKYRYLAFLDYTTLGLNIEPHVVPIHARLIKIASQIYQKGNRLFIYHHPVGIELGNPIDQANTQKEPE